MSPSPVSSTSPASSRVRSLLTLVGLTLGLILATTLVVRAGEAPPDPVATVGGVAIPWSALEERVAGELQRLEVERHQLLEGALDALVEERLVAVEAEAQGVTPTELLAREVEARAGAVTDADVDAWWRENQSRVRGTKEQLADQIRAFLANQKTSSLRAEYLGELRQRHAVTRRLEPLRLPVDSPDAPAHGPAEAPVTVVEFSDFQCPWCQRINSSLDEVKERFGDRVRVVFRHFPLHSIHPEAQKAAEAAECAREQGKFWQMHDALFEQQSALDRPQLTARAERLELDVERFDACLDGGATAARVAADLEAGRAAGVSGTPSLFVNGRPVRLQGGTSPADQLAVVIEAELARQGG